MNNQKVALIKKALKKGLKVYFRSSKKPLLNSNDLKYAKIDLEQNKDYIRVSEVTANKLQRRLYPQMELNGRPGRPPSNIPIFQHIARAQFDLYLDPCRSLHIKEDDYLKTVEKILKNNPDIVADICNGLRG